QRMTTDNPASNEHPPIGAGQPALGSAASSEPQRLPRATTPHALKFRVAAAVLFGIAVGALAIAVVVVARNGSSAKLASGGAWSSWKPDNSASLGISEIAQHVAPYYRLSTSQQLDVITPMQLAQTTAAGTTTGSGLTVAVNQSSAGRGQSLGLLNGRTVAYNVCGLGAKDCELAGTPSTSRMLLLRREALELALYTFKYVSGSQNVVVVLPPGHTVGASSAGAGTGVTVAVLFERATLQPWLDVALAKTLQQFPPAVSQLTLWSKTTEAGLVDQITAHFLFSSQVESQQVGGNLLVLSPLPAQ
ncbi:MAG: hypothetical protein KGL16_10145, partial [Acidobacteriota bacterium]|nr:hypothetical protein [Acidobacteriota bacterium]